jgi:hypothetical protein
MKMPDFSEPPPDREGPANSRPFRPNNRLVIAVAFVLTCLGILIGGHLYGRYLASFKSPGFDNTQAARRNIDTPVVTVDTPDSGRPACLKCGALFTTGEGSAFLRYFLVGRPRPPYIRHKRGPRGDC